MSNTTKLDHRQDTPSFPGGTAWELRDVYESQAGSVPLTGMQALVRVILDRRRLDEREHLDTGAFVSGYPGSPIGGLDLMLPRIVRLLGRDDIVHQPGVNEELAATSLMGTQLVGSLEATVEGVSGYWYGKAPGLDRSMDAIRHANHAGTSPKGGVVAFVGDDPAAKSSTVPSSSEPSLAALNVPVLAPADVADLWRLGLHATSMSRASGTWIAVRVATSIADGHGTVDVSLDSVRHIRPACAGAYSHRPIGQLVGPPSMELERSLLGERLPTAVEYARANDLNPVVVRGGSDRIGIVASGTTYVTLRQTLSSWGLGEEGLHKAGIRIMKVGLVWPLDEEGIREFARGLETVLVIEDKGPFLETLVRDACYELSDRPVVVGKRAGAGIPPLPRHGAVDAEALTSTLTALIPEVAGRPATAPALSTSRSASGRLALPLLPLSATRKPFFCSGCPHNTSTVVPEGSLVGAGIGCHGMTVINPAERQGINTGLTQMGGEGAQWIGMAPFTKSKHMFQNLGDGTYLHSGMLAVRAAAATDVNLTYKILYNSAVAMTGGQTAAGGMSVEQMAQTLLASGVKKVVITTEDMSRYKRRKLPKGVRVHPRSELLAIEEQLAATPGVTVLIHDQECAAELRRKRKRGLAPAVTTKVVIDERVCEGCGDCAAKSNCLSVQPVDTEFGRKTQIHQPSCNADYSCLNGDCPSFLTITTSSASKKRTKKVRVAELSDDALPSAPRRDLADGFAMRIVGIGGTGVVTAAQILATAAFLDGVHVRGLDQTGLSQKAGPVLSDLIFSPEARPTSPTLGAGECDLYVGADAFGAAAPRNLEVLDPARSTAVVNTHTIPTAGMIVEPSSAAFDTDAALAQISARSRATDLVAVDAERISEQLFDTDNLVNIVLLGAAHQAGLLPLSTDAIERAITLNGVSVEKNLQAFRRGRQAVCDPASLLATLDARQAPVATRAPRVLPPGLLARAGESEDTKASRSVQTRLADLLDYQSAAYAGRYADIVGKVRRAEADRVPGSGRLAETVGRELHRLMAYKDEYEVARLLLLPESRAAARQVAGEGARVSWNLHPPVLRALGWDKKIRLGRWFAPAFYALRWARRLRGSRLDIFGYAHVRRVERALVEEYVELVEMLVDELEESNHDLAVTIAALPDLIRGYEHVKLGNVEKYHAELARLRTEFTMTVPAA